MTRTNESLPRLYTLGVAAVRRLSKAEQKAIWDEYATYWRGTSPTYEWQHESDLQAEFQADWLEEREGTYR